MYWLKWDPFISSQQLGSEVQTWCGWHHKAEIQVSTSFALPWISRSSSKRSSAKFGSCRWRMEVCAPFLVVSHGPFSALRGHSHSLSHSPLHFQSQQWRPSFVLTPPHASNLYFLWPLDSRFKGLLWLGQAHPDDLPFVKPFKITKSQGWRPS